MIIDLRTVFLIYVIANALCVFVLTSLWLHNRERYPGITLWLFDFVLQFIGVLLVLLRGLVPDFASMVLANTFVVGGTVALYVGLVRFLGRQSSQMHNYVMIGVFMIVHTYFTYGYPSLALRNVNLSSGLLFICVQASWLMLRRVEPQMRPAARATGLILAIFCLVSVVRIPANLAKWKDAATVNLFQAGSFDAIILITYMVLFVALTFALFILVNRRLSIELENELVERQRAEQQERILLDSTAEAIYGIDTSGNCTFANQSCFKILGYNTAEELIGKNMHDLIHHSYPDGTPMPVETCRIYRAFQAGEGVHAEDEVLWKKDGSSIPVEYWSYPQKVNHEVSGAVVTFIDITERKSIEEKLIRSEDKYRSILDNILEGYFETNLKGDIVFVNDAACNLLGYDKETLYKINYRQFSTPATKKKFQETYREVFRTGIPSNLSNYEIIRGDGTVRFNELSVSLLRDAAGNSSGFRAVARDVTEKKQAEELIRIRLSLLEFAANHSLDELLQKTLDEVGVLVNSPIGFYHFLEEDQNTLSLQAWSTRTLNEFCKAEGKGMHYAIDQAGVWVDCVRERKAVVHNDYNSLRYRKGLPEGHAAVIRELVVPIMRDKNIVAILGVGNKPTEYTEKDIEIISYLADVAWEIAERKKAEEERNQYSLNLRERMKELNCLYSISEIVRRENISQEEILKLCPDIISQAYQFPEITACRIVWGDHEYKTDNFRETHWSQSFNIMVNGQPAGSIEVYCIGGKDQECYDDFFLAEERNLLKNITELLGRSAERKQAEEELAIERQRLTYILEGTNVGTWEWNIQTGETVFNRRWAEIIGYTLEELSPVSIATWEKFTHPDDLKVSGDLLEKHFKNELPYYECEARMRHKNGSWIWVLDRGKVATWAENGKPLIMSGTHQDITDQKLAEEKIKYLATHDPLTDLPTLRLVEDRLAMAMQLAKRHKKKTAVLFIDLDGFKNVNDTLGHDAGDLLLKTLAQHFVTCIRKTDTISRIGGDEFLLVAGELKSVDDAARIAQKVLKLVSRPVEMEGQKISVSASIGISFYPDHGEDIKELIKLADEAMYRVKNSSKNGFAFANESIK
jgi:diguanylate cyclase (GGDEF)-like protein/PAS domain S-box-containing protein